MKKTICLNMVVQNESSEIAYCLESLKRLIDYWVIIDAGSTDGTQEKILSVLQDVPGELHECPYASLVNYRNEALELAKDRADYVFLIDADEKLSYPPHFICSDFDKDLYLTSVSWREGTYYREGLLSTKLNWIWVQEKLEIAEGGASRTVALLEGLDIESSGRKGFLPKDPNRYLQDIGMLQGVVQGNPTDTQALFQLACFQKRRFEYSEALKSFSQRSEMGGDAEEVFYSLFEVAEMQKNLKSPWEQVIANYLKSWNFCPTRAEPLFAIAHYHIMRGEHLLSYLLSKFALSLPRPMSGLFLDDEIYDHKMLLIFADSACTLGAIHEASIAWKELLTKKIPTSMADVIKNNLSILVNK